MNENQLNVLSVTMKLQQMNQFASHCWYTGEVSEAYRGQWPLAVYMSSIYSKTWIYSREFQISMVNWHFFYTGINKYENMWIKYWKFAHIAVWFWFWQYYLTRELIWTKFQSTIRPSICFSLIVKACSYSFLEPTSTKLFTVGKPLHKHAFYIN